jgi:hypothetical protein
MECYRAKYKLNIGKAFMMWYAIEGLQLDEDEALEATMYDGANDKSIDLFYVDHNNQRVLIGQGKFNYKGEYKPKTGEVFELFHSVDWLSNPEALAREGRQDLADAAAEYKNAIEEGYSLEFHFVYLGEPKKDIQNAVNSFNHKEIGSQPPQIARISNIINLQQMHDEYRDQGTRINTYSLKFALDEENANINYFEEKGAFGKALIISVPAASLKQLYSEYNDLLFDRNVRVYLGARKGSVNATIKDTLDNSKERGNFWAYNNGITFVCDLYEVNQSNKTIELRNFSIVNGCQTTVTIANSVIEDLSNVSILSRFISAEESIIDSIILYNNSQTPIRPWEIYSQDKVQKRLKKELSKEPNAYFYQTRKGEKIKGDEKNRFLSDGKPRIIPYEKLAQYLGAFNGYPKFAYNEKSKLFTTYKDNLFPNDIQVEKVILVWECGQAAQNAVQEEIQRGDNENVKILKRGGKLFVLTTMATILFERNSQNFISNLKREVVSSKNTKERLKAYAELSVQWYIEAVTDMISGSENIVQLIRSHDFNKKLKDKIIRKWRVQSISKKWVDDALPKL